MFDLVVVIAIILILAAILVPNFLRARAQGPVSCKSNLKHIGTALEMYSTDNGKLYPVSLYQLRPGYLKVLPTCPASGLYDSYGYVVSYDQEAYTVYCSGKNAHTAVGLSDGYPQYNSIQGLVER